MDIATEYKGGNAVAVNSNTTPAQPESGEKIQQTVKLQEGAVIKGEIVDMQHNRISVRVDNGQVITARLAEPIQAKIGQKQSFTARYDENGKLTLEMKAMPDEVMHKTALSDALNGLGLKNSEENLKIARLLLSLALPLNKETFQKLNQALKLTGSEDVAKALFLLENQMRLSPKNAETLNGFVNGNIKIASQLGSLIDNINGISDPQLKERLIDILIQGESALTDDDIQKNIMQDVKSAQGKANASVEAQITKAFRNGVLSSEGFATLAKKLIEAFPEQKELVAKLLGNNQEETNNLIERITASKPELMAKIVEMANSSSLTAEKLSHLVDGGLQAEPTASDINPTKATLPNPSEIKLIINQLFGEASSKAHEILTQLKMIPERNESKLANLMDKLTFSLENTDPKEIDRFHNQLLEKLDVIKNQLAQSQTPDAGSVLKDVQIIKDNLEFASYVKQNLFIQLPIAINHKNATAELFVFQDKKHKKNSGKAGVDSALIALDTLTLGRVEVYIQKNNRGVNCQFRVEDEQVEAVVRTNMERLFALLKEYDYTLENYSFKKEMEAFTIVDKESTLREGAVLAGDVGRIMFDVRT